MRTIALVAAILACVGCARLKEAVQNIPVGGRLTIPGVSIAADNDTDGLDLVIDTDYDQPLKALRALFWDLPWDILIYVWTVGRGVSDESTDVTDTAAVPAEATDDWDLRRSMLETMKLPVATGDPAKAADRVRKGDGR